MKKTVKILAILLTILIPLISAEELDLEITAETTDYVADVQLKTNPNAESTVEGYDMISPPSPGDSATLISTVGSDSLTIDTWDSDDNPRTLNLVYTVTEDQTGDLDLSWESPSGYTAILTDYGSENYDTAGDTVDMNAETSYSIDITGAATRYIKIDISTTPVTPGPVGGGGAGAGAGAGEAQIRAFTISRDLIRVSVKQGENKRETVRVKNTGTTYIDFDVRLEDIEGLIALDTISFTLAPGQTQVIKLDIFAREDEPLDAFIGRLVIMGGGIRKSVNVIIEVKGRKPLFDILVGVISKKVKAGNDVEATVEVTNMGDQDYIDILLYYAVKDFQGNVITFKEESLAIKQKLKIPRDLEVPDDTPPGDYVFYSKVSFEDITATGVDTFKVLAKGEFLIPIHILWTNKIVLYSVIGLIAAVLISILFVKLKPKPKIRYMEEPKKLLSESEKGLGKSKTLQKEKPKKEKKAPKIEVYDQETGKIEK